MRPSIAALLLLLIAEQTPAQLAPRNPPRTTPLPSQDVLENRPARPSVEDKLHETRNDISDGREAGELSKQDARILRRDAQQVRALAARYGQNGISDAERRELDLRAEALRNTVNLERIKGRTAKL